jgi:hypothetical protein
VTFTGFNDFFPSLLANGLALRHSDEFDARWVLWPSTWGERFAFAAAILRSEVMVRVGMPFEFTSETPRIWLTAVRALPRLRGVNYWTGSDVADFVARSHASALTSDEVVAVTELAHVAAHANLTSDLAAVGVEAPTITVPSPEYRVPDPLPPMPDRFRVLAYAPDGERFAFYGGAAVVEAARRLPEVEFDIVGGTGSGLADVPPNVTFHGWVDSMEEFFSATNVVVRLIAHDAVPGGTVEEGLVFGRHIIYSYPWPDTTHVEFGDVDGLVEALRKLRAAHEAGTLEVNRVGHDAMMVLWDSDKRYAQLRDLLLQVAGRAVSVEEAEHRGGETR